jgi:hypothetical protein
MRRATAFLFLLVFGLAQAGAPACPMGSAGSAPHHAAGHHHPSPSHHDAHHGEHGQPSCGIVSSCVAAAVPAARTAVVHPPILKAAALGRLPDLYLSPVLAIDSPPPRATVAA